MMTHEVTHTSATQRTFVQEAVSSEESESFERLESNVRYYSYIYPKVFVKAIGSSIWSEDGTEYIDFMSGAGALNYGHNNPLLKSALIDYVASDGISHSLDLHTQAKRRFLEQFEYSILKPRRLDYKVQFVGPTGTNAVEAALKLSRKVTGRSTIAAFSNAFHGVSLGSLAVTASRSKRVGAYAPLPGVVRLPYEGFYGQDTDAADVIERILTDPGSGVDEPAAIILETIQGEGGLQHCSASWLKKVASVAERLGALLIIDDIQSGCGRSGSFFSFEELGVMPDLVCLSKSLSGFGLPMSVVLIKRDLDQWAPGEHNGTFRGGNLAFVTATAALESYWQDGVFQASVRSSAIWLAHALEQIVVKSPDRLARVKGRGLLIGIECMNGDIAERVVAKCFDNGLILEVCGSRGHVLKLMPPLTISRQQLAQGVAILAESINAALAAMS